MPFHLCPSEVAAFLLCLPALVQALRRVWARVRR